jgi:hypothetical protein
MLALGAFLTYGAFVTLAVFALVHRRPDAPRWVTASWAGEVVSIAIVAMLAMGVAELIAGATSAYQDGPDLVDLGLLAVVLLAAILIWRKLDLRARMRAPAVDSRASLQGAGGAEAGRGAQPTPGMPATSAPAPSRRRTRAA